MQSPTREDALQLLKEYNSNDSLIKHALAVEGAMRYMARKYNEDENKWGILGLIHDLDYEQFPDQHCIKTEEILKEREWPEEYIRGAISHGWGICTDVEPQSLMEKALYLPFDFCKYTIPREGTIAGRLRGFKKTGVCLQNEVVLCRIFDVQNPFWNGNFKSIQNVVNFRGDLVTTAEPII